MVDRQVVDVIAIVQTAPPYVPYRRALIETKARKQCACIVKPLAQLKQGTLLSKSVQNRANVRAQTPRRSHEVKHSCYSSVCNDEKLQPDIRADQFSAYWRRGHATRFINWCTRLADLEDTPVVGMSREAMS
jgi:hypothetical protein